VNVNADATDKQPEKKARGDWAVAVTPNTPVTRNPLVGRTPAVMNRRYGAHKTPVMRKRPVAAHRPPDKPRPASAAEPDLGLAVKPAPFRGKLVLLALGVVIAIAVCSSLASNHRMKQKAAEQRAAQAYATVTAFVTRVENLKKQVPPFHRQLDESLNTLRPGVIAASSSKELQQLLNEAIQKVVLVENEVFNTEISEEQASQALEALERHADYKNLSEKVFASIAESQDLQRGVDAKCKAVRSRIMEADRRIMERTLRK
jgi:hypothetical protein